MGRKNRKKGKITAARRRRTFLPRIFHRSSRKKKKTPARVRRNMLRKLRNVSILVIIIGLAGGLMYVAVKSVLELKQGANDTDPGFIGIEEAGDVVGLQGVPAYPGSTFMFEKNIREDIVQQFLSSGQSAYVLPTDTDWQEVVDFYNEELSARGWEHVNSIDLADEDHLPGEYWVFSVATQDEEGSLTEDIDTLQSFGLRFYSKIRGIWYERITVEQARSALADEVAQEKEIELLLAAGSMQDLPKTFPWKLSFPELWDVEIRESSLIEAPLAEFSSVDSKGKVLIEPIAFFKDRTVEDEAKAFLEEINSRRSKEDAFEIGSQEEITIDKEYALRIRLEDGGDGGFLAVAVHPDNGIVYAITSLEGEEAFFTYVIENMKVQD